MTINAENARLQWLAARAAEHYRIPAPWRIESAGVPTEHDGARMTIRDANGTGWGVWITAADMDRAGIALAQEQEGKG